MLYTILHRNKDEDMLNAGASFDPDPTLERTARYVLNPLGNRSSWMEMI